MTIPMPDRLLVTLSQYFRLLHHDSSAIWTSGWWITRDCSSYNFKPPLNLPSKLQVQANHSLAFLLSIASITLSPFGRPLGLPLDLQHPSRLLSGLSSLHTLGHTQSTWVAFQLSTLFPTPKPTALWPFFVWYLGSSSIWLVSGPSLCWRYKSVNRAEF